MVGAALGPLDGATPTLSFILNGPETTLRFDGADTVTFDATPDLASAFGIRGELALSESLTVDLHRITVRKSNDAFSLRLTAVRFASLMRSVAWRVGKVATPPQLKTVEAAAKT
jgi:hypothetical protein